MVNINLILLCYCLISFNHLCKVKITALFYGAKNKSKTFHYCIFIIYRGIQYLAAKLPKLFTISYMDCWLKVSTGEMVITYLSPSVKTCLTIDCLTKLIVNTQSSLFKCFPWKYYRYNYVRFVFKYIPHSS